MWHPQLGHCRYCLDDQVDIGNTYTKSPGVEIFCGPGGLKHAQCPKMPPLPSRIASNPAGGKQDPVKLVLVQFTREIDVPKILIPEVQGTAVTTPADALVVQAEAATENLDYVSRVALAMRVTGRQRASAQFAVEVAPHERNLAAKYKVLGDASDALHAQTIERTRLRRKSKRARQKARDRLKKQGNPERDNLPSPVASPDEPEHGTQHREPPEAHVSSPTVSATPPTKSIAVFALALLAVETLDTWTAPVEPY